MATNQLYPWPLSLLQGATPMNSLYNAFLRLRNLIHKGQLDRELHDELPAHLEFQKEENLRGGMSPEDASRQALLSLGGIEQTKESVRDHRGLPLLDALIQDVRFALRSLSRSRGHSFIAIFTLFLGIGATTIIFSIVYSVFFKALPYKNSNRSVVIGARNLGTVGEGRVRRLFSSEEVRILRQQNHVFEDTIAYARLRPTYDDGKSVRYFPFGAKVTTNTFDYLGIRPLLGRTLTEEDAKPGAPPVFVMNYRFWQQEFSGDPATLNKIFILYGKPTTLVGIMPQQFNAFGANFWLPVSFDGAEGSLMGRLKSGYSVRTAAADLEAIAHRVHKANPNGICPEEKFVMVSETWPDSLTGNFKKTLYALLAGVLLLLLIACSNV